MAAAPGKATLRHGGDLGEATRRYGEPPGGWLDLSTGVNPRPYPIGGDLYRHADLHRLPSPGRLAELRAAARRAYGAADGIAVTAAPGTEIVIGALPGLVPGAVVLADTSYRSYREAFSGAPDFKVVSGIGACQLPMDASAIVVNPNNPDGAAIDPEDILALARSRAGGALIIVDEAYADAEPAASVVPFLRSDDPVVVLKSFGKFFGLPGLRLGFAIGNAGFVAGLAARLGDWPVSGPAISVGCAALGDEAWRNETRLWLAAQSQALDATLREAGFERISGCRLFRAVTADNAEALHDRLARRGIWIRIFRERPELLRFGLPPDDAGLARLALALAAD